MDRFFRLGDSGAAGVPAAREGVLTLLASAAALRERAPNHSESLCLSRDTAHAFKGRDASTPPARARQRAHRRWMTIRHSDRHAPGRTQERHLRSKIR